MTARPKPPEGYDENPPLDADFFARARPGEAARLRAALERIVKAHEAGRSLDDAIAKAKDLAGIEEGEEIEKLMLPKPTSPFEQLFGPVDANLQQATMQKMLQEFVPAELSETVRRAMLINKLTAKEPTLYLMPYRLRIR